MRYFVALISLVVGVVVITWTAVDRKVVDVNLGSIEVAIERPELSSNASAAAHGKDSVDLEDVSVLLPADDVQSSASTSGAFLAPTSVEIPTEAEMERISASLEASRELAERFRNEPIDQDWARQMESTILSVVSAIAGEDFEVSSIKCRSTVCDTFLTQIDSSTEMSDADRATFLSGARQLFSESFTPMLTSSSSRLNEWAVFEMSPRGFGASFRFQLYGPPRSDTQLEAR